MKDSAQFIFYRKAFMKRAEMLEMQFAHSSKRGLAWRFVMLTTAFAVVFLLVGKSFAQQDLATVSGTVVDAQGNVVPNASIRVKSTETGTTREATANAEGVFTVPQLRAGNYSVTVTHEGFKTYQAEGVALGVGQNVNLDVLLEVGGVDAIVTISGDAIPATTDTSSSRLGVNISAREVQELPVNGRTFTQLYLNAPGATNTGSGNANEIRFNGRSNQQNQLRYDGVDATAVFDASPGYVTVQGSQFRLQSSLETIQEFRVDSSNYPAEYGTGTGGQINVVGKSGTNRFSGSLYHFFRNDALDARNFFDGAEKSKLRLNQFGGTLGGPILKDRFFFFGSYEGLRQRAGVNIIELTLSPFARDFVNYYGTTDPRGEAARAALNINAATATAAIPRINALRSLGVLNAFPIGNGALANNNTAQFVQVNRDASLDEDVFNGRIDGKINDNHTFYVRLNAPRGELLTPDGSTGRILSLTQKPRNFVAAWQGTFGTSVSNEVKVGFNKAPTTLNTIFPQIAGSAIDFSSVALRLGGNIVSPGVNGGATTGIAEPGGLTRQSSAGNGRSQPIDAQSLSLLDNLSYVRGNHFMKFGGEIRRNKVNFDQLGGTVFSYGSITDFLLNQNLTAAYIGDLSQPGDFRIATNPITTFSRPIEGRSRARNEFYIAYAQDEWKINPQVTLSYGLRYEYYTPVRELDNRNIIFDAASGRILPSDQKPYKSAKNNFAPRLGITWAPKFLNNKTVIRAGGGIFYGPGQFEDLIQPIESNVFRSSASFATGLDSTTLSRATSTNGILQGFTPRAYDVNGYRVPERVAQYSVSVQHELPQNTILTVGYVGSQGRNLFLRSITNTILPGQVTIQNGAALPAGVGVINRCDAAVVNGVCSGRIVGVTSVRQFDVLGYALDANGNVVANPASRLQPFGEIDYKTSGGRDHYNGLQVQLNRRFTGGLTLNGQYQLAKSYGNTQGSNEAQTAQNPYSFADEFGNNTFDIRHSGNVNMLYELPFGNGRRFDLGSVGNTIFGGWTLGGIYNGRSGKPLDIRIARADLVIQCVQVGGCPNAAGGTIAQGTVGRFANPSATSPLPTGFIAVINTPGGNASRNTRRPDLVSGVDPYNSGQTDPRFFLNPAAFAIPQPGSYGNLRRNELYGPVFHQFDMTLARKFRFNERAFVEFRTEIFNIFNRANFDNPPVSLSEALPTITANSTGAATVGSGLQPGQAYSFERASNFGLINSTISRTVGLGTNRQVQFALRLNF